ncbi:MAG: cytochrome c-type biogenesis protein [Pseudomonadota bacterium]
MPKLLVIVLVSLSLLAHNSFAAIEELEFASPENEARYHDLIDVMRCPMCLNANLSGSDAPIAADLRTEIYKQIQAGRSDDEIIEFMRARYGDFIMYQPPLKIGTAMLWFGPIVLLVLGFFILRRLLITSRANSNQEALSTDELQKLNVLLQDSKEQTR